MSNVKRNLIWMILFAFVMLLIPLLMPPAVSAQAPQNLSAPYPGEDGPSYDARMYAAHYGVSPKEAKRRFALQDAAGDLNAQLLSKESATFAGLWLEHKPKFKVVVQFAGVARRNIATYIQNKELASITEVRAAKVSLVNLEKAQAKAISSFVDSKIRAESGINVQKNRVEMYVLEADYLNAAAQMRTAQLPSFIDVITVLSLSQPTAEFYGGLGIHGANRKCTTGFSVRNSGGVKGVLTAGHCDEKLVYSGFGVYLTYKGKAYGGPYEVQWQGPPLGYTVTNKIQWSTSKAIRVITSVKARSNQVINAYVCKYGRESFYTCGTIDDKNYLLTYPPSEPQPKIPFTATFIRVQPNSGYNPLVKLGDSGGPWFNGNTAYGITDAGGSYGIYMAINYLSGIGVSVMTAP